MQEEDSDVMCGEVSFSLLAGKPIAMSMTESGPMWSVEVGGYVAEVKLAGTNHYHVDIREGWGYVTNEDDAISTDDFMKAWVLAEAVLSDLFEEAENSGPLPDVKMTTPIVQTVNSKLQ